MLETIIYGIVFVFAVASVIAQWERIVRMRQPRYIKNRDFLLMTNGGDMISSNCGKPLTIDYCYIAVDRMLVDESEVAL